MKLLPSEPVVFDKEIPMQCGHCQQRFMPERPDELKFSYGWAPGEQTRPITFFCACPKCQRTVNVESKFDRYLEKYKEHMQEVSEKR